MGTGAAGRDEVRPGGDRGREAAAWKTVATQEIDLCLKGRPAK